MLGPSYGHQVCHSKSVENMVINGGLMDNIQILGNRTSMPQTFGMINQSKQGTCAPRRTLLKTNAQCMSIISSDGKLTFSVNAS
jgi:hypothetical protein